MRKIILLIETDPEIHEYLLPHLALLFPECEIEVRKKSPSVFEARKSHI